MNKIKSTLITLLITTIFSNCFSQENNVILTIDEKPVSKLEFEQIYWKNKKEIEATKDDLDEYVKLFTNFKLKVLAAEQMGLDTIQKFKNELSGYRIQLEKPYLTDTATSEELIKEAYYRTKNEINASHLLIKLPKSPSQEDTLKAYSKINEIYNEIKSGKISFKDATIKYSEDPSAKTNYGNLGYFSAFRMVYVFEDACYKTEKGKVSKPFRTQFGYHLAKVNDIREGKGKVKISHIMIAVKETDDKKTDDNKYKKIQDIHKKLEEGALFNTLAIDFSDDRKSVRNGGDLGWIQSGSNYYPVFEDSAFALKNNGDYSHPFLTPVGWHIIKRTDHKPIGSLEDLRFELKNKIQRNARGVITKNSFVKKLKREYNYIESSKTKSEIYSIVSGEDFSKDYLINKDDNDNMLNDVLFSFADQSYSLKDFIAYLAKTFNPKELNDINNYVNNQFDIFVNNNIMNYEKTQLVKKYPEFKALVKEYRDGILLFEISDNIIWSKAIKDTAGLKEFYSSNSENWMWNKRVEYEIFQSKDKKVINKAYILRKKGKLEVDSIINYLNADSQLNIQFNEGIEEVENNEIIANNNWKEGLNKVILKDDTYILINIKRVFEPRVKKLNEAEGLIIASYQDYLETQWLENLHKNHKVVINKDVLYSIKVKR